jgi:hypothetical protein
VRWFLAELSASGRRGGRTPEGRPTFSRGSAASRARSLSPGFSTSRSFSVDATRHAGRLDRRSGFFSAPRTKRTRTGHQRLDTNAVYGDARRRSANSRP